MRVSLRVPLWVPVRTPVRLHLRVPSRLDLRDLGSLMGSLEVPSGLRKSCLGYRHSKQHNVAYLGVGWSHLYPCSHHRWRPLTTIFCWLSSIFGSRDHHGVIKRSEATTFTLYALQMKCSEAWSSQAITKYKNTCGTNVIHERIQTEGRVS